MKKSLDKMRWINLIVHVVYSSSDLYAQCTGVSIISLLENNKDIEKLKLYVLDTDISDKNKENIRQIVNYYNRTIVFISVQKQFEENLEKFKLSHMRGSYNTYARVMLNTWFGFLDRILFIDSDTLVVGSIRALWETYLQDYLLAAVPEVAVYAKGCITEDKDIVDACRYYYFNMGIVLCNLKQWRQENTDALVAAKVRQYDKDFYIADQSILNYALNNRIFRLHLKYNYYTAVHSVTYKTVCKIFSRKKIFSELEFSEARREPVVIHFVGHPFERPWYERSTSPYKLLYHEYRKKTPWANESLLPIPPSKNIIFGIYDYIVYFLKKFNIYGFTHWLRYILGQRIKKISGQKR